MLADPLGLTDRSLLDHPRGAMQGVVGPAGELLAAPALPDGPALDVRQLRRGSGILALALAVQWAAGQRGYIAEVRRQRRVQLLGRAEAVDRGC